MPRRKLAQPRVEGDIAFIPLSRGMEAIIDAADLAEVARFSWHARMEKRGHVYAGRSHWFDAPPDTPSLLHRFLLRPPLGMVVDHIDGDGLNNRRSNLRVCEQALNSINSAVSRRNRLGVKGVSQEGCRYIAAIQKDGKRIHLGRYATPEEASAAYKGANKALYGDFAYQDGVGDEPTVP